MLYHATYKKNLPSIIKNGLIPGTKDRCNWDGICCDGYVFLALDPEAAISYAETADRALDDDINNIVLIGIRASDLNLSDEMAHVWYDWNNKCDMPDDINSLAYDENISPDKLIINPAPEKPSKKEIAIMRDIRNYLTDIWEDEIGYPMD